MAPPAKGRPVGARSTHPSPLYFSTPPLRRAAPFAQSTLAQPSSVDSAPSRPKTKTLLLPKVATHIATAVAAFLSADEDSRDVNVEELRAKIIDGHLLTTAELAVLEEADDGGESATPRSGSWNTMQYDCDTDRSRRMRSATNCERQPNNETNRSRGDRSARSTPSQGRCGRVDSHSDTERAVRTNLPSTRRRIMSSPRSKASRPASRRSSGRDSNESVTELPASYHMASSRAAVDRARAITLALAEAAVAAAAKKVEQHLAACECPGPLPRPRSREEWARVHELRAKESAGHNLSKAERSILRAVARDFEEAISPSKKGIRKLSKSRDRAADERPPVALGRDGREAHCESEARSRKEIEAELYAGAVEADAEITKHEADARASLEATGAAEVKRLKIEAEIIAHAILADTEITRHLAEAKAVAEAKEVAEAAARAAAERAAVERLRVEASMVTEATAADIAIQELIAERAAAKAAKLAARAKAEKEAKEEARLSAMKRKLMRQSSLRSQGSSGSLR